MTIHRDNSDIEELLNVTPIIPVWKLAATLLVSESTIRKNLREPLAPDKRQLYTETIKKIRSYEQSKGN